MFTETVQLEFAATVPPLRDTLPAPATAVKVPPQVLTTPGVGPTAMFAGKVSVKATPLSESPVFGFVIVNCKVVTPPTVTVGAPNDFAMLGGDRTVIKTMSG